MSPPAARANVGLDIGGTKVLAVALGPAGDVVAEARIPTAGAGAGFLDDVVALVGQVAGDGPGGPEAVASLGVGVPGIVDAAGNLLVAPNLPGLVAADLGGQLARRLPATSVWIGNDATCAGWAEHRLGAGRGCDDVLTVTLGTGIGGGIVASGRLVQGANRFAGEIGHMVVDPGGDPCPCGRRGCWERVASGSGLGRLGRRRAAAGRAPALVALTGGDVDAISGEHVIAAATGGDGDATELMGEYSWWLAVGLANLANILDPGLVVVAGGLSAAADLFLDSTREAFATMVEGHHLRKGLELRAALLGEHGGAIGAGLFAAELAATVRASRAAP
ncbi:MAG: ROK family protein [Acidimicrobiales bacterium]